MSPAKRTAEPSTGQTDAVESRTPAPGALASRARRSPRTGRSSRARSNDAEDGGRTAAPPADAADEKGGGEGIDAEEIESGEAETLDLATLPEPHDLVPVHVHAPAAAIPGPIRDPVGRFLAEVRRYPRLSEDEERELGRAVRERGDAAAAKRLVVHNLRLVVAIAHKYRRAWTNILDLFQEGSVGVMEAVKRWEPTLGPRFGSYAAYWIRAYVLKFLMTNSRLIHVGNTRAGRKLFFRLERERQKLLAAGFEPTPKLLAAHLDVDESDVDEVGRHLDSREVSFEPRVGPGSGGDGGGGDDTYPLSERIPLAQASPERRAATAEMSSALRSAMTDFASTLSDARERTVWAEHLAAEEPVSLGEIGHRFGVSKQRMGQIADKLKTKFRDQIVTRLGPDIRTDWLAEE